MDSNHEEMTPFHFRTLLILRSPTSQESRQGHTIPTAFIQEDVASPLPKRLGADRAEQRTNFGLTVRDLNANPVACQRGAAALILDLPILADYLTDEALVILRSCFAPEDVFCQPPVFAESPGETPS
jgi:hypothetical protein